MTPTLRAAIIGTGNAAAMHTTALRALPDVELLAVCSRTPARAAQFAAQHAIPRAYADLPSLLADPDVDVVHICTPPLLHVAQGAAAASAGKHILVDKPIARTVAEARQLVASAKTAGVTFGGVFQKRFMPLAVEVKAALTAGRLGRLYMADAYLKWWREETYFANSPWRASRSHEGGGALINQGIHMVDLLLWLTGPVVEVTGAVATVAHAIEMEDVAAATLRFASGAIGVIQATTAAWPGFPERLELHGANGALVLHEGQGHADWRLRDEPASAADAAPIPSSGSSDPNTISLVGHSHLFADFYAAIRAHREPAVSGESAIHALELVQAVRLASQRGAAVRLPLSPADAAELP